MDHIASLFVRKLAALIEGSSGTDGVTSREIYRLAGLDPLQDDHPATIAADSFFRALEFLAQTETDGRAIGVRLGSTMQCNDYGSFGLAFKSAPNLLGSFKRVERYGRVVTSVANYTVQDGADATFLAIHPGTETRLGQRMTNELALAAGVALCREVSVDTFAPLMVLFSHEAPADSSAYERYFKCPVHFSADRDGFKIGSQSTRMGNRLGDDGLSAFFDSHLDKELAEFVSGIRLDQKVCSEISRSLSEGVPKVGDVAQRLGMSGRTLQRRLADDGYLFQDLVETTRRLLSERLLSQTDFELAEIAFLTGYSEQSTFSRAFKRLHGQTPASFRREHLPG